MIEIKMNLFGAFKKYQNLENPISLKFNSPVTIDQIKKEMGKYFDSNGIQLILDSAIANESEVLEINTLIQHSCKLSILPPVCGG